jgi:two-component system chemotaxis sensor kinase CheA
LLTPTGPIALAALRTVLGLAGEEPPRPDGKLPIVVLSADARRVALAVDAWQSEQELLQKSLGRRVRQLRAVSGAAVLPTGEIALLLKPHELVRSVLADSSQRSLARVFERKREAPKKRVLLADDSATTRTLERSILEAAGYEVLTATDGEQAFKLLQETGADVVVSDVEMPNMDGFTLTESIRATARFKGLPVVLLTALATERDRARGLSAGADAYLVKTAFDQDELIDTLRQLT